MHVHPHRPGVDRRHHAQGLAQVVGPEAGTQAVRRVVHQLQQFFFGVVREEGRNRAECFFVEQRVVDAVGENHRRFNVAAWAVDQVATVNDGVVFGAGLGEVLAEFQLMLAIGDRAEFGELIQW
ncbi:hypothetical protein D3C71_1392170 [compost metagenome]